MLGKPKLDSYKECAKRAAQTSPIIYQAGTRNIARQPHRARSDSTLYNNK